MLHAANCHWRCPHNLWIVLLTVLTLFFLSYLRSVIGLIAAVICGRCNEGYVEHNVQNVRAINTVYSVEIVQNILVANYRYTHTHIHWQFSNSVLCQLCCIQLNYICNWQWFSRSVTTAWRVLRWRMKERLAVWCIFAEICWIKCRKEPTKGCPIVSFRSRS